MKARWLVVFAFVVGCGGSRGKGQGGPDGARDAYESYEQLALIPADSPYAFVSFKRLPVALARRLYGAMAPVWEKEDAEDAFGPSPKLDAFRQAIVDLVGAGLTPDKLAKLGMLESPRLSLYGVEGYPVFRIEIADGARLLAAVEDLAARAGFALPATTQRGEHVYWSLDLPKAEVMISIAPKEAVVALAPVAVMARSRDLILGIEKPAQSLAPAAFRELAVAHGFSGHGVGFLDTTRIIHTFAGPSTIGGQCGAAIDGLAAAVPRLVVGFDVTDDRLGYRAIVEMSQPLLDVVSTLPTKIPVVERAGEPPLMSMTAAMDLDVARSLLPRAADVLTDVCARCRIPDLGRPIDDFASAGWPPYLEGVSGVSIVVTALDEVSSRMEGTAVLHVRDPRRFVSTLTSSMGLPGLALAPDGKAVAFLPGLTPTPMHVAMNTRSVGLGMGPDSDYALEAELGGSVQPAPLLLMTFDYAQLARLPMKDADTLARALALFGEGTLEVSVGDRGLVTSVTLELR
jgi:hypothetical protein